MEIVLYVNGKIKSGKCANGTPWTSAELTNWKNGLEVYCYQYNKYIWRY